MSGKTVERASLSAASHSLSGDPVKQDISDFKPMELKEFDIPVSLGAGASDKAKLKIEISGAEKPFHLTTAAGVVSLVTIPEGRRSPELPIAKAVIGKPDSPDDLSASFTAERDGAALVLNVKVRDDKPGLLSDKGPWDEDALQIYLDALPMSPGNNYPEYAQTTCHIIVAARRNAPGRVNSGGFPGKIEADVKPAADGYEAKIIILLS
jgi:hypothetical protein